MDGVVQQLGETLMDAPRFHDWFDLADSLPDYHRVIRLRVRAGVSQESAVAGRSSVRHQSRGESDLHAHSIRNAEPAVGSSGHLDCVGHHHLDDVGNLAALSLGGRGASAVLRLGFDCDLLATQHYVDELGAVMLDHEHYMRRAIELAANVPDLPFGALITDQTSGEILAEGWNRSSINPTWHGEIDAINQMAAGVRDWKERRLALYTTAEPCPMCQGAILWTGIETVVFGSSIQFLQELGWKQIDIFAQEVAQRTPFHDCTLIGGILEAECHALFEAASKNDSK